MQKINLNILSADLLDAFPSSHIAVKTLCKTENTAPSLLQQLK